MQKPLLELYLEINHTNYIFFIGKNNEQKNFELIYKLEIPLIGIENNRFSNLEQFFNSIKENLYLIEKNFNHTFKDIVIILDNFNPKFINLSGYKKLNGSQILKENIIYILNTLKSCLEEIELKKSIIHIFNSKFSLDNNNTANIPIGLYGDFYSHELSFTLINTNDYKNLKNIFDRCKLKIRKILVKNFIEGVNICENNKNIDTFFYIEINKSSSKIFFFENSSFKFEQNFKFGTDIIFKDISKITSLNVETIKLILEDFDLKEGMSESELIDLKSYTSYESRKIKKKLLYDIALARIIEMSEIMIFKNINLSHYNKISKNIFLLEKDDPNFKYFNEIFKNTFTKNKIFNLNCISNLSSEKFLNTANKIVHFGWKKEAIPVLIEQKTLIRRFFDLIFN